MSVEAIHQLSRKRKKGLQALIENGWIDGFKHLLTDLYPDNAHFIYELLQNAEDAKASEVWFTLDSNSVEFEHNGSRLFSIDDVGSITGIGDTTKKDDSTSIGKFGVGFKAVFAYTSTPEIKSGEYHFRIRDLVVPDTEGLSPRTLDENRTHFLFPFDNPQKSPEKACAEIEKNLRQLGEGTLLFLKNIRKIEYRLPDAKLGSLERIERSRDRIEISVQRPENLAPDSVHYLRFEKVVDVNDEDEGNLKSCRIAVAFGMERGKEQKWKIKPLDKGQVCIYFPAEKEASNLRFHLHAPFASTVARDSIRDCPANDELRDHIADLVTESMFAIRSQGLLDVAFLSVLPNGGDNLSPFYQPIQEKLVEVFKNGSLTPMKRGGHAAASEIYQGSRQLSGLINDGDLATILGKDPSLPLWAANAPQRNQKADNFLYSLGIPKWDEKDLIRELSDQPDLVKTWLKDKSEEWHQEFYALLGDFLSNQSYTYTDDLSNLSIVRISDGTTYKKGEDCYFPSDDEEHDKKFPRVAKGVYSSGKNKGQKKKAREFLEEIGVDEVREVDQVEAILKERYGKGAICGQHHEQDMKRFIALIENQPSRAFLFKDYFIFKIDKNLDNKTWWAKPSIVFLDSPYLDTGLRAYYDALSEDSDRKWALSPKYEKYGIEPEKLGKFAKAVDAQTKLEAEPQKKIPFNHPERFYLMSAPGERKRDVISNDYTIPEFKVLLDKPNLDKALLIWRTMDSLDDEYLKAKYRKNVSGGFRYGASSLIHDLRKAEWVPQKYGEILRFVRPCDASSDHLPEGFPYKSWQEWISSIEFGKRRRDREEQERITREQANREYRDKEEAAKNIGFASYERSQMYVKIDQENPEILDKIIQQQQLETKKQEKTSNNSDSRKEKIPFHKALCEAFVAPSKDAVDDDTDYGGSVQNPALRRDRTSEDIAANIAAEGKQENRSYFTTVKKWTKKNDQVRITLIEWYRGQCQICDKTFTQSNGEPYFEGLYLVSHTTAGWIDRVGNVLCLCPWHSAMFQFGPKEVDEDIIQQILRLKVQAEGGDGQLAIKLRLCEKDIEIKFAERHLIDLQEMIKKSQELERPVP
ncbi:MAG: hypothetical protein OXI63_25285 [Candidatus Poribacteria bacterium]|nr:hypothetical protein [Candidatus Poribacteria bacterium]